MLETGNMEAGCCWSVLHQDVTTVAIGLMLLPVAFWSVHAPPPLSMSTVCCLQLMLKAAVWTPLPAAHDRQICMQVAICMALQRAC
jgi:hypothetical protein